VIEERRTDAAVPNSRTADLSILPLKGSKAGGAAGSVRPCWIALWFLCAEPFAFCRSAACWHWWTLRCCPEEVVCSKLEALNSTGRLRKEKWYW